MFTTMFTVIIQVFVCSSKIICIPSFVLFGCGISELHGHLCPHDNVWRQVVFTRTTMFTELLIYQTHGPFVYRDHAGWPASLPYIRKICVSMEICTQSRISLHERVKIWGSSKKDQYQIMGKWSKFIFIFLLLLLFFNSRISKTRPS